MTLFSSFRPYAVLITACLLYGPVFSQSVDYSSYEIAKKYQRDNNILMVYKHLIIFKYANINLLNKQENRESLKALDSQIRKVEDYLQQDARWAITKKNYGFTNAQLDSAIKAQGRNIILRDVIIH